MQSDHSIAITSGNINGIGPEVVIKTLFAIFDNGFDDSTGGDILSSLRDSIFKHSNPGSRFLEFIVVGSLAAFHWHARKSGLDFSTLQEEESSLKSILPDRSVYRIVLLTRGGIEVPVPQDFRVLLIDTPISLEPESDFQDFDEFMDWALDWASESRREEVSEGKKHLATSRIGENAYRVLVASADLIRAGRISAVVNAPVSKESIVDHSPLKNFTGHTEFYAEIFATKKFSMTFFSPLFHLVLLTSHIPISKVTSRITAESVHRAIDHALEIRNFIGDHRPILFLGVNPHAGENGKIGEDDGKLKALIREHPHGDAVVGPVPADTAFIKVFGGQYRIVIACYHDQGLIPLKSTGDNIFRSVDVTWGLPFVRVTVDHGTAFDIAGKNIAQPFSLMSAMTQALWLMHNQPESHR